MALRFDEAMKVWVAEAPDDVREALHHPKLRVRPPDEPVPRALVGTDAGEVFALLVRMNDGEFHSRHKPAVQEMAQGLQVPASEAAKGLWEKVGVNEWLWRVPVNAVARALGCAQPSLRQTEDQVAAFVKAIAPGADAQAIEAGSKAARELMAQGPDRVQSANRIAMMQQALDATSGWIGNTLVALQQSGEGLTREFVQRVAREKPAVLNTRRFAAEDTTLAGQLLQRGDAVVLLIGAAGYGFGAGAHQCPGEAIAAEITYTAIGAVDWRSRDWTPVGWRPLANARIPIFKES